MSEPQPTEQQPESPAVGHGEPDVTVIIPTYNAMPYLVRCLDSVVGQTIGLDKLQVVAVDDGSTDGSGDELEALAANHPCSVVVLHQENSGGPALPCNRGLDIADGRWVFFLGADDYLAPNALARLVEKGDAWNSDVIFGMMRGENGRFVDQRIFRRTRPDVDFSNGGLAYSLSNTKLFRRSMIDEHAIRFALDLRVASDQPFVVEALARARRVSVLADQVYYHAVKRVDASNISYAMDWRTRLADTAAVMDHIAQVLEPGPDRDAIFSRHFTWEISKLLRRDFPTLPPYEQSELLEDVAEVFDRYDTAGLNARLGPRTRVRLRLAQTGQADLLRQVVDYQAHHRHPPLALRSGRCFRWMPGMGSASVSDDWYRLTNEDVGKLVASSLELVQMRADDKEVTLTGRIGVTADSAESLWTWLMPLQGRRRAPGLRPAGSDGAPPGSGFPIVLQGGGDESAALSITIPVAGILTPAGPASRRWAIRLSFGTDQVRYDLPLMWAGTGLSQIMFRGWSAWRVMVRPDAAGHLLLKVERLSRRRALRSRLGRVRRRLLGGSGPSQTLVTSPRQAAPSATKRGNTVTKGER